MCCLLVKFVPLLSFSFLLHLDMFYMPFVAYVTWHLFYDSKAFDVSVISSFMLIIFC